jgi:hypothetical protein
MFSILHCKRALIGLTLLYLSTRSVAQETSTAAPAVKTFALQSDITGAASNSVNLFNGDVVFPLNLVSLTGHNGLELSVSLMYNSNVREQAFSWNLENPGGTIGLGWTLDIPKIVADYKQTGAREDDEYYLLQGGSSNMLIRTTSGYDSDHGMYYYDYGTKNYMFWKIRFYYDTYEVKGPGFSGGPNKWVVTTEDGTQYIYGDQYSGRNTVQYMVRWNNWMGNSAQVSGQGRLAVAWNLSQVINRWNERMTYEYEQVEQYVGSTAGLKHTEACYLKQITDMFGRKVQFFYNDKSTDFYTEPHTERPEPDAYQENYEKKYLDHLDVILEDGSKLLAVQLEYDNLIGTTTGSSKMLLTSLVQKNGAGGKPLPGMKFLYHVDGSPLHGCIKTITYPTGGSVTYTYSSGLTLNRSNRERQIIAPAGYAEPKTFIGEDYVAVIWRQLGSNGTHDAAPKTLLLYMYTWAGEWKEQFIGQLGNAGLQGDNHNRDYDNFQVTMQKDFFAVLTQLSNGNHTLYIVYRNAHATGNWIANPVHSQNFGSGDPVLLSGTNFIAVGPETVDGNHSNNLYTFTGNGWNTSKLNVVNGNYYYTASNNFLICQKRTNLFPSPTVMQIYFNYLTEDRKWVTKQLGSSSMFESSSSSRSYWYSGNSLAIAMASGNQEYAYQWDFTYNNFFRNQTNASGGQLFGSIEDWRPVYIPGNGMVGIFGRLARFDGVNWYSAYADCATSFTDDYYSYGDDYVVRPRTSFGGVYNGGYMIFDPNTLAWQPDIPLTGSNAGQDVASAGIDYFYYGNGYFYRNRNGVWEKKVTYSPPVRYIPVSGYPRFDVIATAIPFDIQKVIIFRNGNINEYSLSGRQIADKTLRFKTKGVGSNTIVSYQPGFPSHEDVTLLELNRVVTNSITGYQVDYPVTMVTVHDGSQFRYTSFQYNSINALVDASGYSAQYNEVTVIPGSNNPNSRPYGYTKTYFNNGLTNSEMGIPTASNVWLGSPYATQAYDNTNQLIKADKTDYTTYSKNMINDVGNVVYTGYYVRPTTVTNTQSGIQTVTTSYYDENSGFVRSSTINDYNSKQNQVITSYKYFWEQYDPGRTTNILSPVIQTKKTVSTASGVEVSDITAITWKSWNNVFAPHKTYQWKRTGNAEFDFGNWSGAGEPATDWIKMSQVDVMDAVGNILQVTNR